MKVKVGKTAAKEVRKYAKDRKIPVLTLVHFWVKEGKLGATNLEKGIVLNFTAEGDLETEYFNLPEKALALFEKEEELDVKVGKKVSIKGKNFKMSFAQGKVEGEEQQIPREVPDGIAIDKKEFSMLLKKIKDFRKKGDYSFNSFFVEKAGETLTIFTTDRVSLARGKVKVKGEGEFRCVVGDLKEIFDSASKLFEEIEIGVDKVLFYVKGESGFLFSAVKEVAWPEIDVLDSKEYEKIARVKTEELKNGIEDAILVFTELDESHIKLKGEEGKICIVAESEEGDAEISVDAEVEKEFVVKVDANSLLKVLNSTDSEELEFYLADGVIKIEESEEVECPVEYAVAYIPE